MKIQCNLYYKGTNVHLRNTLLSPWKKISSSKYTFFRAIGLTSCP